MDELNTFVLAYLWLAEDRRARAEQVLLIEASHISQGTCHKDEACQAVLADLLTMYTDIHLSFYDICPVNSFERVN